MSILEIITPAVLVGVAAFAVSIITHFFEKRRFTTTILMQVIQQLNDIKHREARKILYEVYPYEISYEILEIPFKNGANIHAIKKIASDIVRGDLNEIATLSHHGLIDESIFIKEFYWIMLRVWYTVEPTIIERRKDGPSDYMMNFEELKNKTESYAKQNRKEDYDKLQKYRKDPSKKPSQS